MTTKPDIAQIGGLPERLAVTPQLNDEGFLPSTIIEPPVSAILRFVGQNDLANLLASIGE